MKRNFPWLYGGAPKQASQFGGPAGLQIPVLNGVGGFNATSGKFSVVPQGHAAAANEGVIAKALSNPSAHTSHAKGGKSDAQREAEQVARAIEQMTKAQQDWENEVQKTGNPIADQYTERLREINEQAEAFAKDKVPADKVKAFTDRMKELATELRDSDIQKFQKEFDDQTAEMAARMRGPAAEALQQYQEEVSKLSDQLARGEIKLAEYNDRLALLGKLRDDPMAQVNAAIEEQIQLLGMSNEQQEIYNNLKQAGVRADEPWGQVIVANTERLQAQRQAVADQIEMMDGLRESAHTFLDDLQHGEGVWKSLKDAASQFLDVLIQIGERQLIEQIFGKQGTAQSGSAGGGWLDALLGLFTSGGGFGGSGSPLAAGGPIVGAGTGTSDSIPIRASNGEFMIRASSVRHYGPDLLHAINQGRYPAFASGGPIGSMPAHHRPQQMGAPVTINFIQRDKFTKETGTQAGKRAATELRMATSRNS
jgi:hypothetical protein